MGEALAEAKKAAFMGEVPVGCVIVKDGEILSRGHNLTETDKDPTLHAEMIAIKKACSVLGGWRLPGCAMYVTLEPCAMCAGAIIWSRIEELYIGTWDSKAGCCGSVCDITGEPAFNHHPAVTVGVRQEECAAVLKNFFRRLRKKPKKLKE